MHVLIPDLTSAPAKAIARDLEAEGHEVHTCGANVDAYGCAALAGRRCPLDVSPVDVCVDVGREDLPMPPSEGARCAVRRRVPTLLVGDVEEGTMLPSVTVTDRRHAVAAVREMANAPMAEHTAVAAKALLHELRRQGSDSRSGVVEVRRRAGGLVVDLWLDASISRMQAERLAAHVAQQVRIHDPWARALDATVHL
ncbi:MAG TPA: hypothetical protein VEI83_04135 [Acidimicrobiales bacterium]|nr:hypothetical protein [Acidimicrobiales bacterium]